MVTAKGEESDVVLGLGVGADDYIVTFSPKELVARVKAVLRRGALKEEDGVERIVREGLVIDKGRHEVLIDGRPVTFTPTELRLLHSLAHRPGRVFTRAGSRASQVGCTRPRRNEGSSASGTLSGFLWALPETGE